MPKMKWAKNLVKDDTPIKDCLKVLKDMFLEATPLCLRRLNYFNCSQTSNESVAQFWARKRDLASQCDLVAMKTEDIEVMELIRNVNAPQLRTKFLEVKDPKVPAFLQIAANWQRAKDVSKNMEATAKEAKATSTYKKEKDSGMKSKVKDKSKNQTQSQGKKDQVCWGCGSKEVHSKKAKNKDKCPGKDKTCHKCQAKGHLAKYCPKDKSNDQVKAGKVKVGMIRCRRLKAARVEYDMEPTPNMEDVAFTPIGKGKFKTTIREAFPDSGCE